MDKNPPKDVDGGRIGPEPGPEPYQRKMVLARFGPGEVVTTVAALAPPVLEGAARLVVVGCYFSGDACEYVCRPVSITQGRMQIHLEYEKFAAEELVLWSTYQAALGPARERERQDREEFRKAVFEELSRAQKPAGP